MRVAYVVSSSNSRKILRDMIIPQMEAGEHVAEVVGMFFVFDNTFMLLDNTDLGGRIQKLIDEKNIVVLACDQCVYEREIEDKLIKGAHIGCFPMLYGLLKDANLDQVITI